MKIFIISLAHSFERRSAMQAQCEMLGLSYEIIDAVNGKDFSKEEVKKHTRLNNYAFLPGEIGCSLSHIYIYKKMLTDNIEEALVLEDDVLLPDNLPNILEKVSIAQEEPKVLLLSRVNKYLKRPVRKVSPNIKIHKAHHATTSHSYIINLGAAKNLSQALYPVWITADKWNLFEDLSLIKVEAVIPAPVNLGQAASKSTINAQKEDPQLQFRKRKIWNQLMKARPFRAKLKNKLRRSIYPIFNRVVDQGKGPR
ncbi:glycosyltransferase family 25 protein [[Erwinia] mediterraneensis]|uniref:glycosyltransferase family 25 protein n=1 Tax=[Erwinia] mediterraneensis TaxID=2161819 RepID=UPI001030694D|nr:glycosyltransferase family 25 protein [[Erwinia] mediterraneensis]